MDAVAIIKSVNRASEPWKDNPLMTIDRELFLAGLKLEQEAACADAHIVTL